MIVKGLRGGARETPAAADLDVVTIDADVRAEGGEPGRDARDPVGLLVAKLTRAADDWTLTAVGTGVALKTPTDSIDALLPFV